MYLLMRIRTALYAACGVMAVGLIGCGGNDTAETPTSPTTQPIEASSPGAAPTFGKASGMGFATGDAIHTDGQGSGMAGYHGTGAAGTAGTVTDTHPVGPPPATTEPVLPPA
jgi:hypothetical protein